MTAKAHEAEEGATPVKHPHAKKAEKTDREIQMELLRNKRDGIAEKVPESDIPPSDHVAIAERGLDLAEKRLLADPNNVALKEDVDLKKRNLDKAKKMRTP